MKIEPIVLDFLRQLAVNNNKAWFDSNRSFYEAARKSFYSFAGEFLQLVAEIDPSVGLNEVKNSVYRINRDLRFSPDKRPYKQHFSVFAAPGGKNSRLPGYYFHLEPSASLIGSGQYGLSSEEVKRLRREVCNFPEDLIEIVEREPFSSRMQLSDDEKLKTFPRGYPTDFVGAEYLKYKSLSGFVHYSDEEMLDDGFAERLAEDVRILRPLNGFFTRALTTEPEDDIL